jgi:sugar O-acyltransferase (sialic acid O-acetyltransferase NeuD family)
LKGKGTMIKKKKLAIIGASGHGKVVADAALTGGWDEIMFFDDAWPELTEVGVWQVVGNTRQLLEQGVCFEGAVVAIGDNLIRLEKQHKIEQAGIPLVTIIHPSAVVSPYSEIGKGSVVFAGAVINAFAKIGYGCIINTGSTIDHDCVLADGVHVSPGAHLGGNVHVGKAAWVGIGSSVRQCIQIGENVVVGAGAAVVNDIEPGFTVIGVPARAMTKRTLVRLLLPEREDMSMLLMKE